MQQVAILRETEHQGHIVQHIDDWQDIDNLVAHHLADDGSSRSSLNRHRVTTAVAATSLDAATMQHGDTQNHALLQHQRQDEQQHGAGDTHRGVAHGHLTTLDNATAHAGQRLDLGSQALVAHSLCNVGECGEHRLVAHHHAHVAVERDVTLLATGNTLSEVARHMQDAIAILAVHRLTRLLHISGIADDGDFLRRIHAANQVATHRGAIVIDDNDTLVAHHLGIIDEGIQNRIDGIEQQEEDDHALVAEDEQQLAATHLEHLYKPQEQSAMFHFLGHILIKAHTRD